MSPADFPTHTASIVSTSGVNYALTDDDLLTLARSIEYEGRADAARIAWTYAQRFVMLTEQGAPMGFADMVRYHSQPINPRWFPDGEFCRPGGSHATDPACAPARAAARLVHATMPWAGLSEDTRRAVNAFVAGELPNPVPRATDFRATDSTALTQIAGAHYDVVAMGVPYVLNTFLSEPTSRAWGDNHVQLEAGGRRIGAKNQSIMAWLLFGAGALGFGWVLYASGSLPHVRVRFAR